MNDKKGLASALSLLNQRAVAIKSVAESADATNQIFWRQMGFHGRAAWARLSNSLDTMISMTAKLQPHMEGDGRRDVAVSGNSIAGSDISSVLVANLSESIMNIQEAGSNVFINFSWHPVLLRLVNVALGGAISAVTLVGGMLFYDRLLKRWTELVACIQSYGEIDEPLPTRAISRDEFGPVEVSLNAFAITARDKHRAVLGERESALTILAGRSGILARTNEGLRDMGKAFIRFLTDISHDLRTPLAIIRGESEIVLKSDVRSVSEYKSVLARVVERTDYLLSLVDHLLYTARLRVASSSIEPETFDLIELVEVACDDMSTLASKKAIDLVCEGGLTCQPVFGDRVRLREMLLSVIDNAINYSNRDGTTWVRVVRCDDTVQPSVSDNGIGISGQDLPNIFKRFYRAKNAISINSAGTGIGLAVGKGIVEADGGSINISSEFGRGTTVTVELPAVDVRQKEKV